jgi:NAD(P)H-flavin reductase
MENPYQPIDATIIKVIEETPTIKTFVLEPEEPFRFTAGQFAQLTVYGVGEGPFTPSSSPYEEKTLEFTVMKVGRVTSALHTMEEGQKVGLRGPLGIPYPLEKFENREVFVVGGGVGYAPLRSLLLALFHDLKRYKRVAVRFGARTPQDICYKDQIPEWEQLDRVDIIQTVDVGDEHWKGPVGVVTVLLEEIDVDIATSPAVVCGPPIMMHFVTKRLLEAGFKPENIYLSMEKNMSCGVGQCRHCQLGEYLVCKDGPVMTWDQVKHIPDPF